MSSIPLRATVLCALLLAGWPTDDSLIGIWSYRTTFGSAPEGTLMVTRGRSSWTAALANMTVTFRTRDDSIRFALPSESGEFRGTLVDGGRSIDGYWIRPAAPAGSRTPGNSIQGFATPLVLRRTNSASWSGIARPLADPFTLYLRVFRNEQDALTAAFRNPEQHSHGPAMQYRVTRDGDRVRFNVQVDSGRPPVYLDAALLHRPERLRIFWDDLGRDIELTRRENADAVAFFPRAPKDPAYVYRRPPETGDGWETARASDVGIDEAAVTRAVQQLSVADPAARRASLIHSLLIARHGKLVVEEYFFGFGRDSVHDIRSAGKTFASVFLGTAMRKGIRLSPETKIYDLMRELGPFSNPDPRKSQITLAQLMTHSAGFACDDYDDNSPGNENKLRQVPQQWKYTLGLPVAYSPGTHYAYCSANLNLISGALTKATGTWLPAWFDQTVARPLQFGRWYWNLTTDNEGYLGGGARLRPRDLLKVGQVYLNGGVWRGWRIIDSSWVALSTAPHFHISPATTHLSADEFSERYGEGDDGYAWHLGNLAVGTRKYRSYAATGNGGQILLVVPELDMTAVFTGGNYQQGGIWLRWTDQIIGNQIIRASLGGGE
ncbi:MAG: 6-aminohexanoate hydrolase [Gemmatimonadetes bacterium]|nr:MAG: 6-aminohexanoate hydrolase [Gemmatimonadota bacterium]